MSNADKTKAVDKLRAEGMTVKDACAKVKLSPGNYQYYKSAAAKKQGKAAKAAKPQRNLRPTAEEDSANDSFVVILKNPSTSALNQALNRVFELQA